MTRQNMDDEDGRMLNGEVAEEVRPFRDADHAIASAFLNRWSPRAFTSESVDEATLMSVFEAARWAASSFNEQPWRFVFARTEEDRKKFLDFLVPANQVWAKDAPVLLVVVAKKTFTHNNQPNTTHHFDSGCASGYLTLQASLNGLYAHGMVGFDAEQARTTLEIPEDFVPLAVFALGYRGEAESLPAKLREREQPSGRRPVTESIMEGHFQVAIEKKAEAESAQA